MAVASRDPAKARAAVSGLNAPPEVVDLPGPARADIVVEAAPAAAFRDIATLQYRAAAR